MDIKDNFARWYEAEQEFICGHCQSRRGYSIEAAIAEFFAMFDEECFPAEFIKGAGVAILKCQECKELNVVVLDIEDGGGWELEGCFDSDEEEQQYMREHPELLIFAPNSGLWGQMKVQGQYPHGLILDKSVPPEVSTDLLEAYNCLAVNAANASAALSRRVVQRIALSYNIAGINARTPLSAALRKLKECGKIEDSMYDALMEVKTWGDSGVHPGNIEHISLDDARQVAKLATQLVKNRFPETDVRTAAEYLRERRRANKTP